MSKFTEDICSIGDNVSAFADRWGCNLHQYSIVEGDWRIRLSYEQIGALYDYAKRYKQALAKADGK